MLINIHTHNGQEKNARVLESLYKDFPRVSYPGHYSIGLHPWFIGDDTITNLEKWSSCESVLAIGECGLDKLCKTDFEEQKKLFIQQVHLANKLQKPLIIHCVKAWEEVLIILKELKITVPVIFHGFNKNELVATRLVNAGYYISLGISLESPKIKATLSHISLNKVFFETDSATVSIQYIYELAAKALAIDIEELSLQIEKNAKLVFGTKIFEV